MQDDSLITEVHRNTNLGPHLAGLFDPVKIGPINFGALAQHCVERTQTQILPFKIFRRFERLSTLLRYALYAHHHAGRGSFVECGVLRGFSALALSLLLRENSKAANIALPELWLIDSFEGLSEPSEEDFVQSGGEGSTAEPAMNKGHFATPAREVQKLFSPADPVKIVKGWIPKAFDDLPDTKWSFVHLDVDLYRPIAESLEYFYPRLLTGGVIVNDDFGSASFPGAGKAWREFFASKGKGYAILDNGQAAYIHA